MRADWCPGGGIANHGLAAERRVQVVASVTEGERSWREVNRTVRPIAVLGLASLISGVVVGGIGGRLVMSVSARAAGADMVGRVTENGNVVGEFTVGGTAALIVFVGLLGGMLASVGVVASDPWLRWLGPFRGVGFGLVVLTVFGYDTFASIDFRILDPVSLNVAMFLALILGFGLAVVGFQRLLDRKLPGPTDSEQMGWIVVVGLGAIPLLMTVLFFTSTSFCGCDPAHEIGASLMIMILATAAFHLGSGTSLIPAWGKRIAMIAGYLSLASAVSFGLVRTIDNLQLLS